LYIGRIKQYAYHSYSFFLRLYNKFARTQHSDDLDWPFHLFRLLWGGTDLNAVHEEPARVELVEVSISFPFLGGFEDQ
jgi:hypothetical protein